MNTEWNCQHTFCLYIYFIYFFSKRNIQQSNAIGVTLKDYFLTFFLYWLNFVLVLILITRLQLNLLKVSTYVSCTKFYILYLIREVSFVVYDEGHSSFERYVLVWRKMTNPLFLAGLDTIHPVNSNLCISLSKKV